MSTLRVIMGAVTPTSQGSVRKNQLKAAMCWRNAVPIWWPDPGLRKGWPGRVPVSLTFPGTYRDITVRFLMGLFFPFCSLLFKCLAG